MDVERYAAPADPDDLDEDYITEVLNAVHEGLLPAIADAIEAGEVTDDLADAHAEVYDDVDHQLEGWEYRISGEFDGQEVAQAVEDPEPRRYRVVDVRVASDDCLAVNVEYDDSGWYRSDDEEWVPKGVNLVRAEPSPPTNPTPWRIAELADEAEVEWCA